MNFDAIAVLEKHPTLKALRDALAADEGLCREIHAGCYDRAEKIAQVPVYNSRAVALTFAEDMAKGEKPLLSRDRQESMWRTLAAPVFLFKEAEPALHQHRVNRVNQLEAAFAAPVDAPLPQARRARF